MFSFKTYLIERDMSSGVGVIKASGSDADRHHKQYHSPEAMQRLGNEYTLASDHKESGLKAGDKVKLDRTQKEDGKYYGYSGKNKFLMSKFYKPRTGRAGKDQEAAESAQVEEMQRSLAKAKGNNPYVRLHIGNGKFVNVASIRRIDKDYANQLGHKGRKPKADIAFLDHEGNAVSFHSLKASEASQQFGGVSGELNTPEVKKAIDTFKTASDEREKTTGTREHPKGLMLHHDLDENDPEHRAIIHRAMYGSEHSREYGLNNVHSTIIGQPNFVESQITDPERNKHKGIPSLDMDGHAYVNTNDEKSDTVPSKIVNRKAGSENSAGINAGRILIVPKYSPGYKQSIEHTGSVQRDMETLRAEAQKRKEEKKNTLKQEASGEHAGGPWLSPSEKSNDY